MTEIEKLDAEIVKAAEGWASSWDGTRHEHHVDPRQAHGPGRRCQARRDAAEALSAEEASRVYNEAYAKSEVKTNDAQDNHIDGVSAVLAECRKRDLAVIDCKLDEMIAADGSDYGCAALRVAKRRIADLLDGRSA